MLLECAAHLCGCKSGQGLVASKHSKQLIKSFCGSAQAWTKATKLLDSHGKKHIEESKEYLSQHGSRKINLQPVTDLLVRVILQAPCTVPK